MKSHNGISGFYRRGRGWKQFSSALFLAVLILVCVCLGTGLARAQVDGQADELNRIANTKNVLAQDEAASGTDVASLKRLAAGRLLALTGADADTSAVADENGSIVVQKKVESEAAFEPSADQEYEFTIYLQKDGADDNSNHYCVITDADGSVVVTLDLRNGDTFNLMAGQQMEVVTVENGESYRVVETPVSGFTTTSENAEGTVVGGKTSTVIFTNTLQPQSVTLSGADHLKVTKRLDGEAWDGQTFSVTIRPDEKDYPKPEKQTIELTSADGAEGTIVSSAFGDITFERPGTYTYTIAEDVPTSLNDGVTYSSAIYKLTVVVTENSDEAKLELSASMTQVRDDDANTTGVAADDFTAAFVNTFREGEISIHEMGEKVYVDETGGTTLQDGQFAFNITANSETPDAPLPKETTVHNVGEQVFWPSITFTSSGTYKYDLKEVVPSDPTENMEYDEDVIVATVVVGETGTDGVLSASVTYYDETTGEYVDKPTFTNTFTPENAKLNLEATKTLNGRNSRDGEYFTIVAKTTDDATEQAIENGWITAEKDLKDGILAEGSVTDLSNGVASGVELSTIEFSHVGTYRFTLTEVAGDAANMTYDVHSCTVIVDVTYSDGKLVANTTYVGDDNSFVNKYVPTPVVINDGDATQSIKAIKNYTSYDYSYENSFTFYLKATGSQTGVEGPETQTLTVQMNPNTTSDVVFPESILFASAGTYTYEITEVLPDNATDGSYQGLTYDTHVCEVTVTVTDDAESGKLVADISYDTSNEFTNTAKYVPATLEGLYVTKVIEGGDRGWLDSDEFTMRISAADGTPMPENTTVVCTKDNPTQSFGSITYTDAGTYEYTITEDNSNLPSGFEENTNEYTVYVTTTPTYTNLAIAVDYGNDANESLQVENQYKSTVLSAMPIQVSKELVGTDATSEDQFQINMEYVDGDTTLSGDLSQSVSFGKTDDSDTNLTDGATRTRTFPENLLFTQEGSYRFKLTESIPADAVDNVYDDITYDDSVYYAIVNVTNNFDTGGLDASVTYTDADENVLDSAPVFVNRYKANKVTVVDIEVNKVLTGRDWVSSDQFMFTLKDKSTGNLVSQATVTQADNPAKFDAITYYEPGTYTYVMSEIATENPVTLDSRTYDVKVVVSEASDGSLSASVSYYDSEGTLLSAAPTFTNVYSPNPAYMYINIEKIISGRGWRSQDMYEFKLEGATGTEPMPTSQYATINENTEPVTWFQPLTFTELGTYTYYVSEVQGSIIGIDYSDHVCTVVITVYDDPVDGTYKADISYDGNSGASWATFTNTYSPLAATAAPLSVTKSLVGRAWNDGDVFEFTCTPEDGAPEPENTTVVADINSQTVNFGDITFTEPGNFTYEIQELAGTEGGMSYDTSVLYYEVTVDDPGTGELEVTNTTIRQADGTETDGVFTNTYTADPTTIDNIQAEKILDGRPWLDSDDFEFTLTDAQTGEEVDIESATKDNQTVTFKPLTFEEAGTYTYYINETHGDLAGMTYDDSQWKAVVKVEDNGQGNLVATLSYVGPDGQTTTPTFTNTYTATPVTVGDIEIQKLLVGRDWRSTDEFSFYVTSSDPTAPLPTTNPVVIDASTEGHSVKLEGMTYATSGTYTYEVRETVDKEAVALKYDTDPKTITVEVTPDYDNATYRYKVLYTNLYTSLGDVDVDAQDKAVFNNVYAPTSVTARPISVSKTLEGRDWLDSDSFDVKLTAIDDAPMPSSDTVTLTKDSQSASFGDITYELPGTYEYALSEVQGDIEDITYDQSEIKATVVVIENDRGDLAIDSVTYTDEDGAEKDCEFVNEYTPGALTLSGSQIKVEKLLHAPSGIDVAADIYSFTLTADDATDLAGATKQTATIMGVDANAVASGSFSKNIVFKKAGTYTFSLRENAPANADNGITYDTSVHTVTVVVSQNQTTNQLQAQITYDDGSPEPVPFLNEYKARPVTVSGINATKVLEGREWTSEDSFEFDLTATGKTDVVATATATKDSRTATFGDLTFDQAGTYYYTITEKAGDEKGVAYDTQSWDVIVDVVDDGTGTLAATVSYRGPEGATAQTPTFTNIYTPDPVTVDTIEADKELDGRPWLDTDSFDFVLVDDSGKQVATATATDADKTAKFGSLEFDKAGIYVYTMKEVAGDTAGVTYDSSEWKIKVVVTNNDQGSFEASVTYEGPDGQTTTPIFKNTYAAKPVTVGDITVEKIISGRNWEDGDSFTFTISPDDPSYPVPASASLSIDASDADHKATFDAMTFDAAGTYVYTVRELATDAPVAMKFDLRPRTVTIKVVPDYATGSFTYQVVYGSLSNSLVSLGSETGLVFTNVYDPTPVTAQPLSAEKNLVGRDWYDTDSFIVKISAVDGAPMPSSDTVELTKDNKTVSFGSVTYDMPGVYEYTMTEVKGDIEDVTYDQKQVIAKVTVVQDEKGDLVVSSVDYVAADGSSSDNVFTNEYVPGALTLSGSELKVEKLLEAPEGVDVANDSYGFTLKADDTTDLSGATEQTTSIDDVDANVVAEGSFGKDIVFKKAGTYTFTLTENVPDGDTQGVTYDTSSHTVTVVVTQNPDTNDLQAQILYDGLSDPVVFKNTYAASPVTVPGITATKILEGRDWNDADAFEFEMTEAGKTDVVATATATSGERTAAFIDQTFDTAGTYYYTITEKVGTEEGITYDSDAWTAVVHVVDGGSGKLSAEVSYKAPDGSDYSTPTFTNTYTSDETVGSVAKISGLFTMDGHSATEDQFQFSLTPDNEESAALIPATTFTNKETVIDSTTTILSGATTLGDLFNNLKLTNKDAGKTYKWTLTETSKAESGYTIDSAVHTIEIKVATDSAGATILTVYVDGKSVTGDASIVFTNSYYASTKEPVSIVAKKVLENETLEAGQFSFTLYNQKNQAVAQSVNDADGTVSFGGLSYDTETSWNDANEGLASKTTYDGQDAIKYTYSIVEDTSNLPEGMHAVRSNFSVAVYLTDNGDGTLTAHVEYPDDTTLVNAYETNAVTLDLSGLKLVTTTQENVFAPDITGKYTFTIQGSDGAPMPEYSAATNGGSGTVDFGNVVYTIEDLDDQESRTFTYTVVESGSVEGVTNDASDKSFSVTVTNKGDGVLAATVSPSDSPLFTFENTYEVSPVSSSPTSQISISKDLEGRPLEAGDFTFQMEDDDGNVVATVSNEADGSITLPNLTFDTPGTYVYTVGEVAGAMPGVTYDTTIYTLVAVVSNDGNGTMSVDWSIGSVGSGTSIVFANTYKSNPGSVSVVATKVLKNAELKDGEFDFELIDSAGSVVESVSNSASGAVAFTPLTFDSPGTYSYTIKEVKGSDSTITYDDKEVTVTITVTEDYAAAKLVATVSYDPDNVFTNVYTAPIEPAPDLGSDEGNGVNARTGKTSDGAGGSVSEESPVGTRKVVVPHSTLSKTPRTFDPTSTGACVSYATLGVSMIAGALSYLVVTKRRR